MAIWLRYRARWLRSPRDRSANKCKIALACTGLYWVCISHLQSCPKKGQKIKTMCTFDFESTPPLHWACVGLHWACTGLALGCTGLHWGLGGALGLHWSENFVLGLYWRSKNCPRTVLERKFRPRTATAACLLACLHLQNPKI